MADNGLPPPPPGVQWADSSSLPPPPPGVKWADQSPASQPAVSLDNVQGSASTTATPQGRAIDMTSQPGEAAPPSTQPAAAPAASGSVAPAQPPPAAGPTAAPGMPAPPQGPPQTSHDAAYQNALTPPDVTQSAIPPPLSPNPPMPPPPAGVLPPAPAPGAPPAPAPSESFMAPIERGADNLWNSATSQIGQMASGAAQVAKQVWNDPISSTQGLGNVGSAAAEHFSGQLLSTGGQMLKSADQTVREHLFHQNDLNRIAVLKVTDPAKAAVMQAHLDATLADPSWVGKLGGILTGRGATIQAKAFSDLSPQDQRDVSAKVTDGHYNIKAAVYDLSQQAAPVAAGAAVGLLLRNPAEGEVIAGLTERAAAGGADSVMAKAGLQAANSIAKRNVATAGLAGGFTSAGLYATQTAVDVHDTIIHDKATLDNPEVKGLIASGMKPDSAVSMYATLQMNKAYFPAVAFWTAASTLPGLHFGEGVVAEKASALLSGAGHGAIQGGGNQMIANDASGQPLMQDVGKSAATMAGITAPFGLMHGDAGKPEDMAGRNGAASEPDASKAAQPFNDAANNYAKAGTDPADVADRQSKVSAIQAWGDANGGRTPAEKSAALKQLATTGELPDYVKSPAATTPRAASVTDQLAKQGIQAPVAPDGRVTVPPDLPKASDAFNASAHDAAESPHNDFQPVTPGQALHGNYRVGKSLLKGNTPAEDLKVNIENPTGSIRKAPDGSWQQKMTEHYGYFPGTHGADGQPLDLVAGRKAHDPSLPVFVVHQTDVTTGAHDELKVVLGAKSEGQAKQMYLNQYPRTLHDKLIAGTPKIVKMSRPQFAQWMKAGDHATPVSPISKQPIPALRQEGEVHASFDQTAQPDDLQARADALSKAHDVPLKVSANGEGHSITGTIPKAKLPAIDRALRGIDGHQETTYNGADASTVFSGRRESGGGRVPAPGRSLDNGQLTGGQQRAQPSRGDRPQAEGAPKEAPTPGWLKKVTSDAPLFQRGQGAHPSSVVGVHYSKKGDIEALDPDRSGSSSPERGKLLRAAGNPAGALAQAVHFYVRQGDELPVKEPRVGGANPHAYEARLNNLYDVAADPDGILQRAEDRGHATGTPVSHDAIVKAILKAGYDGTVHRGVANDTPVATVFGSGKILVREAGAETPAHDANINEHEARMTDKVGVGRLPDGSYGIVDRAKYQQAVKDYTALKDSHGGKIISADVARELSTDYLKNRTLSVDVHEVASQFAKEYFKEKLAEPHAKDSYVLMTAGGTGAGKSVSLEGKFASESDGADFIYDTNMNTLKSSEDKINKILASGREVHISFTYRDPVEALTNGALKRAESQRKQFNSGRTVPLSTHAETHTGVMDTMHALRDKYKSDRRVKIQVIDNTGVKGGEKLSTLADVKRMADNHGDLMGRLKSALDDALQSGAISKETYDGFSEGAGNDATGTTGVRESAPHDNGAAGEGSAGVRPVRQRDAAWPEVRGGARPADAVTPQGDGATDQPNVGASESATEGNRIQEVPVANLQLSSDVPQFKSGANDKGVVEPLGGKFDRRGTGPIQVWRRTNGQLEVISGRHRLDLARRSGEQTIPAQVYNEADGFDARKAASLDAELNIRDGQGKVKDYVNYFQNSGIDETTADARGLLARATGKRAHAIATQGDAGLIAAHSADRISDEAAVQIAQAAPNDGRLQALGMKLVQEGKPITVAANTMRAVRTMARSQSTSDMFGFDDSAIKDAEKIAQAASAHQRDITERLAAITGASKRPDLAKREGINVRNPEVVQQRVEQLRAEKDAWSHFDTDPAKMDQLRQELGMEKAPEPEVTEPKPATSGGDMFGAATTSDHIRAAQEGKDAQRNGLTGGKVDTGEGGLFDGKRPLQERVPDAEVTDGEKPRLKAGDQAADSSGRSEDHVAALTAHIQKISASWKGAPETLVVDDRSELPPEVRNHLAVMGGAEPDGLYYGGKVYLVGKALDDPAHAERVLVHETLGHHGLRYTFGEKLPSMLQSVFDAVKTKPEFLKLANRYRQSYAGMKPTEFNHAITEEYLSNGAELQKNPGVLSKVVAFVRNWARGHGMVHDWSENDVVNLMHGVAQNVRQGRVSRFGYSVPTTTFDNDARTATSSYQGAAGEGTVTHLPDGDRVLAVGGMSARLTRTMTDEGMGLEVSNLKYSDPKDLLAITRFAGEEGKSAVLFPKEAQDDLDRAHIPNEVVGDRVQTPSSTLPPGPPRLSMRNPGGKPDDPDLTERMDRTIAKRETEMSPWDRLQHLGRQLADKEAWRDRLRAGFAGAVDQFAPLARIEKEHGGTGKLLDASESAYKAAWMSQNVQAVMGSVVRDGIPVYRDGGFQTQAGRKGWVDILSPLYQHADPEMERKFSFYLGTVRGERLLNEINPDGTSREKNFTPDDIAAGKALEAKFPFFKTVADDIQQFNHHLIDLAVERGNMTPETGEAWKANFYVPFYRAMEEEGMASPGQTGGLKVKSKYLSGGGKIEPPLDSMLQNTMAILDRVYKNEAVRRAIAMGQEAGLIHPIGMALDPKQFTVAEIEKRLEDAGLFVGRQANGQRSAKLTLTEADRDKYVNLLGLKPPIAPGSDVTYAMHNGRAKFYRVDDPQVLRAITDITQQKAINRWFSTLIGGPARLLRNLTVHTPSFMFRHLFRQTLDAQLQSSQNPVLLRNSLRSSIDAYTQGPLLRQLAMAGSGGNEYYQIDQMHEEMRRLSPHATILDAPRKLAMAYHKVGYVADQMNRLSVAKGVLDRGGSTAEAAWQAQDLLNFGMHGGNIAVRYLMKAVPFLNARTQGAYRIVRGATGADSPGKVATALGGRLAKGFLYKGALFTAAALALQAKNNNDPRYEKLSDQQKDMYFNFFVGDHHYALPIPFELGAIFATLPSRLLRRAEGIDDNKVLWQSIQRTVESTMRLDPTDVAMITPLWEDQMNKDKLSQRAIVSERYSHIDPKEQFTPYTSPVIKAVAQHMPDAAPDMLRSPLRLQHLVYGYFSTVGRYAVDAADAMARVSGKAPVAPASNSPIGSLGSKVFGAMVSRSSTDPRNSAESTLDDNYRRLVQVGNTINAMKKNGDVEQLNRYYATNGSIMQYKVPLKELYDQMGNAHKAEAEIYQSTTMTADEKRTALNKITKERDALLQQYAPLLRLVDETN